MPQPDIQSGKSIPPPRDDGMPADAAETRAFDEASLAGGPALAGPDATAAGESLGALKSAASEFRGVVTDVLKGKAGSARTLAADAYEQLRGKSGQSLTKADELVRKRPYAALGAAVVFGMLVASLTRKRR